LLEKSGLHVLLTLVLLAVAVLPLAAEESGTGRYTLTLDQARELARSQAPHLLAARSRADVARGERVGASVWQPFNPELTVAAGPRRMGGDRVGTDVEVEIGQRFELGGRRRSRLARADAGIAGAVASADDAERELLREVSTRFLLTLHAERSLEVARESERVFRELRRVTERRYEAGDVGILDPYAAAMADARSRGRLAEVEVMRALAAAGLRGLLGLEVDAVIAVEGDLADRSRYSLSTLVERAADRPDLKAIESGIERARAEQRLARGYRAPELGAFASYGREEGADIVQGGLSIVLPFLDRGQGRLAVAEAEERSLEFDLQAARAVVDSDVSARFETFSILDAAATRFESEALARLQETLDLARQSYEAGNIPFAEMLVLQRETVETRQAHLDLLLQAALAGVELEAVSGVW